MYYSNRYRRAILSETYPGTSRPMETLRQCDCGRMTFLDLPCAGCGAAVREAALEDTDGAGGRRFHIAVLCAIVLSGAVAAVVGRILLGWPVPAAMVPMTVLAVLAAERKLRGSSQEDQRFFWRFHSDWMTPFRGAAMETPVLEAKSMESLIDAWYLDMDRLERLALRGDWETARRGARQLACVYRNPRLARLQYKVLLHMPGDGREGFDFNEICGYLDTGDIPDEDVEPLLGLIGDIVRQGASPDQDNIKKIFPELLRRYLGILGGLAAIDTLWGAMGEPLFLYCGGHISKTPGGTQGDLPADGEGRELFFRRLSTELARQRKSFIARGTWYPILRNVANTPGEQAAQVLDAMERCFFRQGDAPEPRKFYDNIKRAGADLLHPEQRRALAGILRRWVVDETGRPYAASDIEALRVLAAEKGGGAA